MGYELKQNGEAIDNVLNRTFDATHRRKMGGQTMYPGGSFEEGVRAGIKWLLGMREAHPLEDEPDELGLYV